MPEEVLFETERRQHRGAVADYLRTVAEKLESGEEITLSAGDQSVALAVPDEPTFEVKVERETSTGDGSSELSVEFELEWDEDAGGADSSLSVE